MYNVFIRYIEPLPSPLYGWKQWANGATLLLIKNHYGLSTRDTYRNGGSVSR